MLKTVFYLVNLLSLTLATVLIFHGDLLGMIPLLVCAALFIDAFSTKTLKYEIFPRHHK